MDIEIVPSALSGIVSAVSSKSDAHRHIIAAALSDRPTRIILNNTCADIEATIACVSALGARVIRENEGLTVCPVDPAHRREPVVLECGESGSTARFLLPVAAALCGKFELRGEGRLPERPFAPVCRAMAENGCVFSGENIPFYVSGVMRHGDFYIAGNVSSQFISGLLFALPLQNGPSRIIITTPLESKGYIDMTLSVLSMYGIRIEQSGDMFFVPGGQKYISPGTVRVEGDWSNSAFWLCAGAICGEITVEGLNRSSLQGDRAIIDILKGFGAKITMGERSVTAAPGGLCGREIDVSQIPDLVPALAVLGTAANGNTIIKNAARLRIKESDRLGAIAQNLSKIGADIEKKKDSLVIFGGKTLAGGEVDSFNDHRIAMAMAVASVLCRDRLVIKNAGAVSKSYPAFFEDFKRLGGKFDVV
jgi:3-phosphoshikimate 1-carboxyvinyltransferase